MKIYSYVLNENAGFKPNPFFGFCTLAVGQPLIRQVADVGDWVVGLKELTSEDFRLVFAMNITEKLTYEEYWHNPRFKEKIPDLSDNAPLCKRFGDNIYRPLKRDTLDQVYSLRSKEFFSTTESWEKAMAGDLQGKYVLVADRHYFYYFGKEAAKLPSKELLELLHCDIGHKCIADPDVPSEFLEFLKTFKQENKVGFLAPPFEWPSKDDSWKECLEK